MLAVEQHDTEDNQQESAVLYFDHNLAVRVEGHPFPAMGDFSMAKPQVD